MVEVQHSRNITQIFFILVKLFKYISPLKSLLFILSIFCSTLSTFVSFKTQFAKCFFRLIQYLCIVPDSDKFFPDGSAAAFNVPTLSPYREGKGISKGISACADESPTVRAEY